MNIQTIILQNLIRNSSFGKKVIPFLKSQYFLEEHHTLYKRILKYVGQYSSLPTKAALAIDITDDKEQNLLETIFGEFEKQDEEWLLNETEKWIKERALRIALMESVAIYEGKDQKRTRDAIPSILQDALAVSFDKSVGHDYFEDVEKRHMFYTGKNTDLIKIPFRKEAFNKATNGGCETKSLNMVLGGTGGGKTLTLCDLTADWLRDGWDVLYITLEMADVKIAQRVDANLMDVEMNDLKWIDPKVYGDSLKTIQSETKGRFIVKEYPAGSVHVGHVRALLNELKLKKDFDPTIICVDYLNLLASSRYKHSSSSYEYVKGVAEEIRGLGQERNKSMWSASQLNRDGLASNDPDVTNTSESVGLAFTADFMMATIADDILKQQNKMKFKQISKNRYEDINKYPQFMLGCNRAKMKLYDLES